MSVTIESLFEAARTALDEADKTSKTTKTQTIKTLAQELETKIRIDSIAEEIVHQLHDKISKTFVYDVLDPKYKSKKRSTAIKQSKTKKIESPLVDLESPKTVTVSNTGQQTTEPEPVYNQGQTIDESKAPDQGIITGDDSKIQYWKPEPDTVPVLPQVQTRDDRDLAIDTLQEEITKLRAENSTLKTELAQTRSDKIPVSLNEGIVKILKEDKWFVILTRAVNKTGAREIAGIQLNYSGEKIVHVYAIPF